METEAIAYLGAIVRPLVSNEEAVSVTSTNDDRGLLLSLYLDKSDMGRVIGKEGETARSIRRIMRQFGMSRDSHIAIKIVEPS